MVARTSLSFARCNLHAALWSVALCYGVSILGLPSFFLTASGAPALTTAGLQLFQWAVTSLGFPETYRPTCTSMQESVRRLVIGKGPSKHGPKGVTLPFFINTCVAFSAEEGQYCGT